MEHSRDLQLLSNFPDIQKWLLSGSYVVFGKGRHQVFTKSLGRTDALPEKTLLILHGFPESSFSFHKVLPELMQKFDRIILFDFIGFGLSDKPKEHFSYSLLEQADLALAVWQHFGIIGGHLLAHDMGDSVATELLHRQVHAKLPKTFRTGFLSVTLTNGSIVLDLASLRITQRILLSPIGGLMTWCTTFGIFKHQVQSAHGNARLSVQDLSQLWKLNTLQNGHRKAHFTIRYLNDRKRYEKDRWLAAIAQCKIPVHLCWGEDDRVAQIQIVDFIKENIQPEVQITRMKKTGHFCQIGNPDAWVESVRAFYAQLSNGSNEE